MLHKLFAGKLYERKMRRKKKDLKIGFLKCGNAGTPAVPYYYIYIYIYIYKKGKEGNPIYTRFLSLFFYLKIKSFLRKVSKKVFYSPSWKMVRTPCPVAENITVFSNCSCSQRRKVLLASVRVSTNTVFSSLLQYSGGTTAVVVGGGG